MNDVYVHTSTVMDTVVSVQIVGHGADAEQREARAAAAARVFEWFTRIEECCTRFDPESEVRQLTARAREAVQVSPIVFETVRFALALAEETEGAFDPTVGHRMEAHGFDRNHRSGERAPSAIDAHAQVSYRDVALDAATRSITLRQPLVLDLGAVAKGFAIDVGARELEPFENFAIDAGGDLYLGGHNQAGEPWSVGIRHPREPDALLDTLHLSNTAVCTSGDYERQSDDGAHHILNPQTGAPVPGVASVTVVAPVAMLADGLATAAFVLGPAKGIELLERHGVRGTIVTTSLERFSTRDTRS